MILGGKSWPGWIARTAGATAVWLGGGLVAVRERFAAGLAIREALAEREPGNAGWQRDLYVSHGKLGGLALAEGDRARALVSLHEAERVMAALCARWPDHPGFARDLAAVRQIIAGSQDKGSDAG
ncbi:hypothetical protein [Erythrobacter cryptus]|uniref:hypothetical protein n=1 Tax=Erythrobacter cryptus TaxID=196588 RepID=UPI0004840321|nr:hypothetical protein [Erythrobacter cryptus]